MADTLVQWNDYINSEGHSVLKMVIVIKLLPHCVAVIM